MLETEGDLWGAVLVDAEELKLPALSARGSRDRAVASPGPVDVVGSGSIDLAVRKPADWRVPKRVECSHRQYSIRLLAKVAALVRLASRQELGLELALRLLLQD